MRICGSMVYFILECTFVIMLQNIFCLQVYFIRIFIRISDKIILCLLHAFFFSISESQ